MRAICAGGRDTATPRATSVYARRRFYCSGALRAEVADGPCADPGDPSRASLIAEGEVLQLMTQNNLQTTEAS